MIVKAKVMVIKCIEQRYIEEEDDSLTIRLDFLGGVDGSIYLHQWEECLPSVGEEFELELKTKEGE